MVDLKGGNTENTTAAPNGTNKAFKHQATRLIPKRYPCIIQGKTLKLKSSNNFISNRKDPMSVCTKEENGRKALVAPEREMKINRKTRCL